VTFYYGVRIDALGGEMKVTYDAEAKALYVYIIDKPWTIKTEELIPDSVFIHRTELGQIVGIEILDVDLEDITRRD